MIMDNLYAYSIWMASQTAIAGRRRKKLKIKARDIPCPEAYLSYAAKTTE
jgi:hypothetical protein